MGLEMIIGLIVAALAAIAGAFGLGKSRGTSIAETKADRMGYESLDKDEQAAIRWWIKDGGRDCRLTKGQKNGCYGQVERRDQESALACWGLDQ